ncbi:hypothetical protein GA0115246_111428 [Streptomyces sp. SolWspMP-sol7th]|nr:hypothetical protein GA0115246_111428 [Streptomyces sp. SolWspMP-sol7th]
MPSSGCRLDEPALVAVRGLPDLPPVQFVADDLALVVAGADVRVRSDRFDVDVLAGPRGRGGGLLGGGRGALEDGAGAVRGGGGHPRGQQGAGGEARGLVVAHERAAGDERSGQRGGGQGQYEYGAAPPGGARALGPGGLLRGPGGLLRVGVDLGHEALLVELVSARREFPDDRRQQGVRVRPFGGPPLWCGVHRVPLRASRGMWSPLVCRVGGASSLVREVSSASVRAARRLRARASRERTVPRGMPRAAAASA